MKYPDDFVDKVIHADCMELLPYIPNNSIDLIIIDSPYGINYSSNGGPRVSKNRKDKIAQETKINGDAHINPEWFVELYRVLRFSAAIYVFCNFSSFPGMMSYIESAGFKMKTPLIWDKGNCGMGDLFGDYGNQVELIIYAVKGKHKLNGGRDRNILKFQRPSDAHRLHPTQKPEELIEFLIKKSSQSSDLVLDCFAGSGTTAVACKKTNRRFVGCDNDIKYVNLSNQRLTEIINGLV